MKKLVWTILGLSVLASLLLVSCGSSTTKLRVATDATWAPFEYVNDETKEIEGFDIDVMNAIADKENLDIEFINVGFDPLLAGMAQGTYDAAISCITITEERQKEMLFSDPYYTAGQIVVARIDTTFTSKDDLTGTVGAQIGTTGAMEVEDIAAATLKTYDEIGLAFQDLMNGQIDAVICDSPVAKGYVDKNADKLKTVGEMFTAENYGIAVAKGNTELLDKINAGIKAIREEGLIDEYAKKWLEK